MNVGRYQPGGCAVLTFGKLHQYARKNGGDFRKLGRVASTVYYANRKHRTRVVTAYNVGSNKPRGLKTNYQQQLRYIQDKQLEIEPESMFLLDLYALLKTWKDQGDRLLLFMDANEHILRGKLARMLMGKLGLREATHKA